MSIFDTALATIFSDRNFAVTATYTPVSGSPSTVSAILYQDSPLEQQAFSAMGEERDLVDVRKTDLSAPPRQGDRITVSSVVYQVDRWPIPDRESGAAQSALVYTMRVRKL